MAVIFIDYLLWATCFPILSILQSILWESQGNCSFVPYTAEESKHRRSLKVCTLGLSQLASELTRGDCEAIQEILLTCMKATLCLLYVFCS